MLGMAEGGSPLSSVLMGIDQYGTSITVMVELILHMGI